MLSEMPPAPLDAFYQPVVSGSRKIYYRRIAVAATSGAYMRAPMAISAVSRDRSAVNIEGQEVAKRSVQTEASEALAKVCAGALLAAVVCGLISLLPGLSGAGYLAAAALLVAAFFGTAASEA